MPERAYRKMVISLKRNSTFVEAAQFCNCCILFSGLSAPPVPCPYRAEQATGLAGGYDLCFFSCRRSVSITSYHRPDRDWSVILCALPPPFCLNSAVPPWLPLHGNCHRGCLSCCFYRPPHDICCRWLRSVLHGLRSGLGVECARLLLSNDRVFFIFWRYI